MEVNTIICLTISHICFYELFLLRFFLVAVFIPVSLKHGLRTGYKTRSRYKMRTVDYVGKNGANWL